MKTLGLAEWCRVVAEVVKDSLRRPHRYDLCVSQVLGCPEQRQVTRFLRGPMGFSGHHGVGRERLLRLAQQEGWINRTDEYIARDERLAVALAMVWDR